jgi:two-component system, OmpR family, sensor histidine kinase NblS
MIKTFHSLHRQWAHINIQARIMALVTLAIALGMSGFTFWALISLQQESILTDSRLAKDISFLCESNLLPIVRNGNLADLSDIAEKVYLSTSSVRYLILLDTNGQSYFSLPEYEPGTLEMFEKAKSLLAYENRNRSFSHAITKCIVLFNDPITDIFIPLSGDKYNYGSLDIGISTNTSTAYQVSLAQNASAIMFVSIWAILVLTALLHSLSIFRPIQELLLGIQAISTGNFTARINFPLEGEFANLILSFNEMAEKLEFYDKKNIEQLILEKSKLETLISIIADGAILLDKELRIIFINHAASKTFKFFQYGMVGTYLSSHLPSRVNAKLFPILNKMVQVNYINSFCSESQEISVLIDHGSLKTFRFILTTVLDPDIGVLTGIAIIMQDVTKEIELNEAKAQFISNVSHELRTPLFNIRSFLETLSEYNESLSNKQKMEFLNTANQETQRLTYLVNDVLDLSRLESETQYTLEIIELTEMIPPIIQTSQLRAIKKRVQLSFQTGLHALSTEGYYSLLIQVFSNLIGNALKFTNADKRIWVKVYPFCGQSYRRYHNRLRIEVIDEGSGVGAFDQVRIFDRFVRIENNVHTLEGTGLGLSIVKNIVEKHSSKIHLYSELGVGSSFWFDLLLDEKKN